MNVKGNKTKKQAAINETESNVINMLSEEEVIWCLLHPQCLKSLGPNGTGEELNRRRLNKEMEWQVFLKYKETYDMIQNILKSLKRYGGII